MLLFIVRLFPRSALNKDIFIIKVMIKDFAPTRNFRELIFVCIIAQLYADHVTLMAIVFSSFEVPKTKEQNDTLM